MSRATPRRPQRREDALDGEEVLEITLFAEKREWIQDKITFLSATLPPVIVHDPSPPAPSATTKEALERWWLQHEAIEQEVEAYDYGDLTKMRNFAKEKSKHELSARDTDLIEVCLTTIFALDKLLSLLRKRRKNLVLLGYRLQWEEALGSVWSARRRLLDDELPAFLEKSKFVLPATPRSSSHLSLPPDELDPPATRDSGGPLRKSNSISSVESTSSISSQHSSSAMSRQLRLQTLVLTASSLKSHLAHLSTSLVPTTANLLDRLIDESSEPLPDAFLDAQDRVEDVLRAEWGDGGGNGIGTAVDERVERWKVIDEVSHACLGVERDATRLRQVVEDETNKVKLQRRDDTDTGADDDEGLSTTTRTKAVANATESVETFETKLGTLRTALERARENFAQGSRIKLGDRPSTSPLVRLFPDLEQESIELEQVIEGGFERARTAYDEARNRIERYRAGVEAVVRAQGIREQLRQALERLLGTIQGVEAMSPPDTEALDLVWKEDDSARRDFETRFDQLFEHANVERVARLVKDAYGTVAELSQIGIDPNAKREIKQLLERVDGYRRQAERIRDAEDTRRRRSEAIRRVLGEVERGRDKAKQARDELEMEARRTRWEDGRIANPLRSAESEGTLDLEIDNIRRRLRTTLDSAKVALEPLPPAALSRLEDRVAPLNHELDSLTTLRDAVYRVHAQTTAIQAFEADLRAHETELTQIVKTAGTCLAAPETGSHTLKDTSTLLDDRLAALSSEIAPLISDVHLRIPFLSTSASSPSTTLAQSHAQKFDLLPFDTVSHDISVKLHLNTLIARVQHELDDARSKIELMKAASGIVAWDEEEMRLRTELDRIETELRECEEAVRDRVDDSDVALLDCKTRSNATRSALETATSSQDLLATTLATLFSRIGAPDLPPHLATSDRGARITRLERSSQHIWDRLDGLDSKLSTATTDRDAHVAKRQQQQLRLVASVEASIQGTGVIEQEALSNIDHPAGSRDASSTVTSLRCRSRVIGDRLDVASNDLELHPLTIPAVLLATDDAGSGSVNINATRAVSRRVTNAVDVPEQGTELPPLEGDPATFRKDGDLDSVGENNPEIAELSKEEDPSRSHGAEIPATRQASRLSDVFGDITAPNPFPRPPTLDEPPEISHLRAKTEFLRVRDWLDDGMILRLPELEESKELGKSLRDLKQDLRLVETLYDSEGLRPLASLVSDKELEVNRVSALADFATRVQTADSALSDLLDSIDAATPGLPSPSPTTVLPLSEALRGAGDAVTAVRLEAVALADDRRVTQAIARIEESWAEMLSMVEDVRPRAVSVASSTSSRPRSRLSSTTSSSRISVRQPSIQPRSMSRSSSTSSTASLSFARTRPSSRSTTTPALRRSTSRSSSVASDLIASTDTEDNLATPRRRLVPKRLPMSTTTRHDNSPLPPLTPTTARPFSFDSSARSKLQSGIPRRTPLTTPRKRGSLGESRTSSTSEHASSSMLRLASASSRASTSSRRDSLASSVSSRRSSAASLTYRRPSLSPENLSRIGYRSSPPRDPGRRRYLPNLSNKLDREVGSIVNALDIHVPISMADGSWSDESGMYKIGDKVYFCRILRSKNVMVRVGGGWLNLLQFIITHFAPAETINISPTTPVKRTFGSPQWISSPAMRDQLKPTEPHPSSISSSLFHRRLANPASSSSNVESRSKPLLSGSLSMRRSLSSSSSSIPGTPSRRSFSAHPGGLFSPPTTTTTTTTSSLGTDDTPRRVSAKQRRAIPIWKP